MRGRILSHRYRYRGHRVQDRPLLNTATYRLWEFCEKYKSFNGGPEVVLDFILERLIEVGAVTLLDPTVAARSKRQCVWGERWELNRDARSPIWVLNLDEHRQATELGRLKLVDGNLSWQIPPDLFGPERVKGEGLFIGRSSRLLLENDTALCFGREWSYQ